MCSARIQLASESLESWLQHVLLGPAPRLSDLVSLERGPRICISNTDVAGAGTKV